MQPDLFDVGERTSATKPERRCTPIGTTAGETCRTCLHATRTESNTGKAFYKCALMRKHWTRGPGSDIKLRWVACGSWEPKEAAEADRT